MEPVSALLTAACFAASCVAQRCADSAIDAAWKQIEGRFRKSLSRDPVPSDLTPGAAAIDASSGDSELLAVAERVFDASTCLRRARINREALEGAALLWLDDHPAGNAWERALLRGFGTVITSVETTKSALACLDSESYDVVVSDMARPGDPKEGLAAIPEIRAYGGGIPLVFYIGNYDPAGGVPPRASGITNRPDELVHLLLDVLERKRL